MERVWSRALKPAAGMLLAAAVVLLAPPRAQAQADGIRILTYNTALMYFRGSYSGPVPMVCTQCDPLKFPPTPAPCGCPTMGLWWNDNDFTGIQFFSGIDELTRAQLIADRILATDQDVVALQEVFSDDAKKVFVQTLALGGPYKHFVSKLRGVQPFPDPHVSDLAAMSEDMAWANDYPQLLDVAIEPLDSGLMLFSKHPFLQLTGAVIPNDAVCGQSQCEYAGSNNFGPLLPGFFAFKVYSDASGTDALASKGVGIVKINAPGGAAYVAFTHLQSDADSDGWPSRQSQLATIRDVILGAVPPGELSDDAVVFLAGDLNTYGYQRTQAVTADAQEWHTVYNPASAPNTADGFFACGNGVTVNGLKQPCRYNANGLRALTDSWGFETSTTDEGNDGRRLDYVLHSARLGTLCMQHATIAWDLQADPDGNGGQHWLSDHDPIRIDFNRDARHCSPNDDKAAAVPIKNARDLSFGPTNCDYDSGDSTNPDCKQDQNVYPPVARITRGGGFQWFIIRQRGTYSIDLDPAVSGANVQYLVYHHTDLSRPIAPFDPTEGERGLIWALPDPPYYIRTFAVDAQGKPDRNAKNRDYAFKVHQHLCRSPNDRCALLPGSNPRFVAPPPSNANVDPLGHYLWPQTVMNNPLTDVRELWFMFKTSGVENGRPSPMPGAALPKVRMFLETAKAEAQSCLTVKPPVIEEYANPMFPTSPVQTIKFTAVEVDADKDWDDDGLFPDDQRLAPDLPGKTLDQLFTYYVKLTRDTDVQSGVEPCNLGMTSSLSYHTNLSYLVPVRANATGELDDDVAADDNLCVFMGYDRTGYEPCPLAAVEVTFDVPIEVDLYGYAPLRGYYVAQAWPNFFETDNNERLFVWSPDGPYSGIGTLNEWREADDTSHHLADAEPGEGDYTYLVTYRRCHFAEHDHCRNVP